MRMKFEGDPIWEDWMLDSWRTYMWTLARLKLGALDPADLDARTQLANAANGVAALTEEWSALMNWALDLPGDDLHVGLPGDAERVEGGQ